MTKDCRLWRSQAASRRGRRSGRRAREENRRVWMDQRTQTGVNAGLRSRGGWRGKTNPPVIDASGKAADLTQLSDDA